MTGEPRFTPLPPLARLLEDIPSWRWANHGPRGWSASRLRVFETSDPSTRFVLIVTELGDGMSITNAAEDLVAALGTLYVPPPLVLEHWPAEHSAPGIEHLDQVMVDAGRPTWMRVWPTPPGHPRHAQHEAWIAENRHLLRGVLAGALPDRPGGPR